ncbi:beta strand repeat-containing protein, partial [Phascolarctobacterium succinatutens]|uniref:beta strand repeat-containing protein n=1 Tax=Phascolarctobacterium succinatutens TaxID=626940 RepID=UPI0026EA1F3D
MTRKKSNVKALALAVTCAILAGGGIGLEPVYAADVQLNVNNGAITAGSVSGSITGTVDSNPITNGKITDGSITSGTFTGTVTLTGNDIQTAIASVDISQAKVGSDATSGTIESLVKNVGDNSNAIQAVDGKVTNIQTDVTSLKTTTGQLQTKVGELTASDTAARNDIISLQKKTEGISEDGSEITTNSLKLRESGSSEEQEITAAKVKGYDKAVAAVGDTSAEGTLAYNTQKIKFKKDNKITSEDATYIEGITHAGGVRLADGAVRAKSIVLEEEFANSTSAQATLTRESIVNLNGMTDGKTKIKVADGSEVGGVTFVQGKVTNVVSINDNLKFESDGIYLNKGDQTKQIKIDNDGKIIIGTSSSAYDTDGFYAGGDDYTEAKAAIDGINGKIKGANGAFGVDDNGNVTTTGDIKGKDITASGKLTVDSDATVGGNLGVIGDTTLKGKLDVTGDTTLKGKLDVTGDTTLKGKLDVTGDTTVGGDLTVTKKIKGESLNIGSTGNEFIVDANGNTTVGGTLGVTGKTTLSDELQVDKTATFGTAVGSQTVIKGDQVATGRIETDATQASKIGGVTLQNGKVTATDMTVTGTIDFKNLKVNDTLTVGTNTKITEGTLQLGTAEDNKLTAEKLANINQTIKANRVIDATSATIGGVEINGGNVTATGTVQGKTIYDGVGAKLENGKITAKEGQIGNVTISAAGEVTGVKSIEASTFKVDEDNYLNNNGITAKGGHIGGAVIDATTLTVGVTKLDSTEGITTNKLKIGDMALTGTGLNTGTNDFQVNGVTFNQGKVTAQADKGFVAGTSYFKEGSLIVDANNKLEATHGLTTEKATVNGTLDVTGKATFGTAGKQTTIDGDAITTDTLKANKLILGASGNATVEVDKDGSLKAAGEKFAVDKDGALKAANGAFNVDKDGKTTFTKDADNLSSINGGNIWAKATDIADNT